MDPKQIVRAETIIRLQEEIGLFAASGGQWAVGLPVYITKLPIGRSVHPWDSLKWRIPAYVVDVVARIYPTLFRIHSDFMVAWNRKNGSQEAFIHGPDATTPLMIGVRFDRYGCREVFVDRNLRAEVTIKKKIWIASTLRTFLRPRINETIVRIQPVSYFSVHSQDVEAWQILYESLDDFISLFRKTAEIYDESDFRVDSQRLEDIAALLRSRAELWLSRDAYKVKVNIFRDL